jgi:F-type H+-transporting ATPase subunit b
MPTLFKYAFVALLLALPIVLTSLVSSFADAAAGAGHEGGIPTVVILQFVNFFLYVVLIVFIARTPLSNYFKERHAGFFAAKKKADAARSEAEAKRKEIQDRLSKLETTRDESIQRAREEAEALRKQIVNEAQALSQKLKLEAARTAEVEINRAKYELREELLEQSVQMAKRVLVDTNKVQEQDQKRLQAEFVEKIQGGSQVVSQ